MTCANLLIPKYRRTPSVSGNQLVIARRRLVGDVFRRLQPAEDGTQCCDLLCGELVGEVAAYRGVQAGVHGGDGLASGVGEGDGDTIGAFAGDELALAHPSAALPADLAPTGANLPRRRLLDTRPRLS
ncbi:hypothetical protein OV320_0451 [Actinobacteria bacterium OV320]|nr:hypothetical protein OV320_0451 [Actinobacteria bacterium OV320]